MRVFRSISERRGTITRSPRHDFPNGEASIELYSQRMAAEHFHPFGIYRHLSPPSGNFWR